MLKKIKAIVGLAVLAAVGGAFASLSGTDWVTAFGPSAGAFVSAGVGFGVKESFPRIQSYVAKAFGVTVPPQDQ